MKHWFPSKHCAIKNPYLTCNLIYLFIYLFFVSMWKFWKALICDYFSWNINKRWGQQKSSNTDQDAIMESDVIRLIFQNSPSLQCINNI